MPTARCAVVELIWKAWGIQNAKASLTWTTRVLSQTLLNQCLPGELGVGAMSRGPTIFAVAMDSHLSHGVQAVVKTKGTKL